MSSPLPDFPLEHAELANGLRVVLQQDSSLRLVAVNLWYHVGSKNERAGHTGLAHLFEHMLFQGSAHVGTNDHFRLLQQVGGVANGSTWYDRTNYYETVPSHHLDLALWLEADRMGFFLPALTEEKLENQRQVVLNERRQRVDNQPYGRAFERLHELLYPADHPYHWPVIGTSEDIAAASLEEVVEFFRTYYHPSNTVLTLVGDFDLAHALERVEHYFGDLASGPRPPRIEHPLQPLRDSLRVRMPDKVAATRHYFGFRAPAYGSESWWAADLLAQVATGGKSSLLHHDLVIERQLASDVAAFALPTELAATFGIVTTAPPGSSADELETAVREHLWKLAEHPPSVTDLERARNRTLTAYHDALQSLDQRADLFSRHATQRGNADLWRDELERYMSLTGEELRAFAESYLAEQPSILVTVDPDGSGGS